MQLDEQLAMTKARYSVMALAMYSGENWGILMVKPWFYSNVKIDDLLPFEENCWGSTKIVFICIPFVIYDIYSKCISCPSYMDY